VLLQEMQTLQKCMQRVMLKCQDERLTESAFYAQANYVDRWVVGQFEPFGKDEGVL